MTLAKLDALLIAQDTLDLFLGLALNPGEGELLDPVPEWLAEAAYRSEVVTFGLGHDRTPVGLISLIDPRLFPEDGRGHFQPECLYVWRVMIDKSARGRGFGRAAIGFAQDYAALIGLKGVSLTTKDTHPRTPLGLYRKLGFVPTGRRLGDEMELRWTSRGRADALRLRPPPVMP